MRGYLGDGRTCEGKLVIKVSKAYKIMSKINATRPLKLGSSVHSTEIKACSFSCILKTTCPILSLLEARLTSSKQPHFSSQTLPVIAPLPVKTGDQTALLQYDDSHVMRNSSELTVHFILGRVPTRLRYIRGYKMFYFISLMVQRKKVKMHQYSQYY